LQVDAHRLVVLGLDLFDCSSYLFFFQAEDGIRDRNVTGVQTCALPISELGGDPASVLLVLFFVIAGMAWCLALLLPMMVGGYKVALALLLPYLGAIFLFPFAGVKIFENPPAPVSTVIWAGLALAGLAL